MGEYQYYEFLAIDRPLTKEQINAVRRYSSRAEISATRFVNEYNYGDFRGDERQFLTRYFDAMVYVANWGTHRFMFNVPLELVDLATLKQYCADYPAELRQSGDRAILDLVSQEEDGGEWEEGSDWMDSLAPLRAELLDGDLRILYLAWLLRVSQGEADDDELEPPVPAGLAKLSPPQQSFVDFMRIDANLLAAAAQASAPAMRDADDQLAGWIAALPQAEKDAALLAVCEGDAQQVARRLRRQFQQATHDGTAPASRASHRTVGQLRQAAESRAEERRQADVQRRAAERARREAAQAAEKTKRLKALAQRQEQAWLEVEQLVESRQPQSYDQAVSLLCDLRDLATQQQAVERFTSLLVALRSRHVRKTNLRQKLNAKGLRTE